MPIEEKPPRGAGKAAIMIVAILAVMVAAIFVGFNLNHSDTLEDEQSGQVEPRDAPTTPNDLQRAPQPGPTPN